VSFKGVDYYKIDDLPSDDEKMIRSLTREFLEEEVEKREIKTELFRFY